MSGCLRGLLLRILRSHGAPLPRPESLPANLSGETKFKDDVLETWAALSRCRDTHPEHFTTMNNVPLLFALDSYACPDKGWGMPGWVWTEPVCARTAG